MSRLRYLLACVGSAALAGQAVAQADGEQARVLAVADSALVAISRGDAVALTDLMLDEAIMFASRTRDGEFRYFVRTRAQQRESKFNGVITERGYRPEVRVQGPIAVVWYPYDLHIDGKWSHCGIDVFTLLKQNGRWRIATMAWSAEQPPVCAAHPAGPPRR
ncbi:MAG: hypothetical protein ACREOG_05835 [Gemmatimonadaceae bacterium]